MRDADAFLVDEDGDWDPTRAQAPVGVGSGEGAVGGRGGSDDPRIQEALAHYQAKRFAQAGLMFRAVLADTPERADARHGLGLALMAEGRLDEAGTCLEESLRLDATQPDWHHNAGLLHLLSARPRRAERHFRRALDLGQAGTGSLHALGELLFAQRRFAQADDLFGQLIERGDDTPTVLSRRLTAAFLAGRVRDAQATARRAVERHPTDGGLAWQAAGVLAASGLGEEALALIGRARSAGADPGLLDLAAADVLLGLRRIEEATGRVSRQLVLDPARFDAFLMAIDVFAAAGDRRATEALARRALIVVPGAPLVLHRLGLAAFGEGTAERAIDRLGPAYEGSGADDDVATALGQALVRAGRLDEAAQFHADWAERDPKHPWAGHMAAALCGRPAPERLSDAALAWRYDRFHDLPDDPPPDPVFAGLAERVAARTALELGGPSRVLDLGAGRGRLGRAVRPHAVRLCGVDASARFVAWTAATGVYDHVARGEAQAFTAIRRAAYELVLAAGVLRDLGKVDELIEAIAGALVPGGRVFLTFQPDTEARRGWRLRPDGRYAHAPAHVFGRLEGAGLVVEAAEIIEASGATAMVAVARVPRP